MTHSIISEIIELAWADDVSFESIKRQTNMTEKEVILLMKRSLKPRSYELWRERVTGRIAKHEKQKAMNKS